MQNFFEDNAEPALWDNQKIQNSKYSDQQASEFDFGIEHVPMPVPEISKNSHIAPPFKSAMPSKSFYAQSEQPTAYQPDITREQEKLSNVSETTLKDGSRVNANISKYYNRYQNVLTRMFLPKHIKSIIADSEMQLVKDEAQFRARLFSMYKEYQIQMAYHNLNALVKINASRYEYEVARYSQSLASQLLNNFRQTLEYHTQELSAYLDRVDTYHPSLQAQATLGANTILEQLRYAQHVILTQFNATLNQKFGEKK